MDSISTDNNNDDDIEYIPSQLEMHREARRAETLRKRQTRLDSQPQTWRTLREREKSEYHYGDNAHQNTPDIGYFNLSCPFEWSKYSCAYMQRSDSDASATRASTEYYLQHLDFIQAAYDHIIHPTNGVKNEPKRIFFSGDSLMRQLFVAIACNAATLSDNFVEHAVVPWKDDWPTRPGTPSITSGEHGGFDAASIRLVNGLELHFVPHLGYKDEDSAEPQVLQRVIRDIEEYGHVTFGDKTAMTPGDNHVDVLVYNAGIHTGMDGQAGRNVRHFGHIIGRKLIELERNNSIAVAVPKKKRTRTIYVTTPSQHYGTHDGQWQQKGMSVGSKQCVNRISANPRADFERKILKVGKNVDAILEYDDLKFGQMHVHHGQDCSHYCMPGVPDVVGAQLLEEILV